MLRTTAHYLTRTRIRKDNSSVNRNFLEWEKIQKIALVVDEAPLNKSEIDRFTEGTKKYVEVFFVETRAKQSSYGDWKCFTKKEKTFFKLPTAAALSSVDGKKFDVTIVINPSGKLFTAYLVSHIQSSFRCGDHNVAGEIDLIIERKQEQNLSLYLKEVQRYLEMIRTGK
jgi:hypothetical protein